MSDESSLSAYLPKMSLSCLLVASLLNFEIVHGRENFFQKVKRIACAFIETFLFYTIMCRDKRKFVKYQFLPDTGLSTGLRAFLQHAFHLVNLLGCSSVP